jgi:hypothetical protein
MASPTMPGQLADLILAGCTTEQAMVMVRARDGLHYQHLKNTAAMEAAMRLGEFVDHLRARGVYREWAEVDE